MLTDALANSLRGWPEPLRMAALLMLALPVGILDGLALMVGIALALFPIFGLALSVFLVAPFIGIDAATHSPWPVGVWAVGSFVWFGVVTAMTAKKEK